MAPKTQAKKNLKLMFILYITFLRSISNILYFPDNDNVRIQTSTAINNITVYMVKLKLDTYWVHRDGFSHVLLTNIQFSKKNVISK